MDYKIELTYTAKGESRYWTPNDKILELIITDSDALRVTAIPHETISDIELRIMIRQEITADDRIYCNGFQSWSYSREYLSNERYERINPLLRPILKKIGALKCGADEFVKQPRSRGQFVSISHCYIRRGSETTLFGSLDDRQGYTVFYIDAKNNTISIEKDFEGLEISSETVFANLFTTIGNYEEVFDKYFNAINIAPPAAPELRGYSSWYNLYRNISEDSILKDLSAIKDLKEKINAFQIDDGYQPYIGDINAIDEQKFPHGLRPIIDEIHNQGLSAGIWICPFGVTEKSETYKNHYDWLIKNDKGKALKVGVAWGGFYALDTEIPEARRYISESIKRLISDYGVDFLKLDFLYAAGCVPRNGKTRAAIMYEAMELLKEAVGDKRIIACGAPIMPAYGMVDYMRIGADCTLYLRKFYDNVTREMLSTAKTMQNSIYRRYYNKRAFINDPDVFYLRSGNIKLTLSERKLHAAICRLFGGVLFTSDNISEYTDEAREFINAIFNRSEINILAVEKIGKEIIDIRYTLDNAPMILVFNYKSGEILRMQPIIAE